MKADLALGTSASVPAKLCRYTVCNCLNPPTPVGAAGCVRIPWESSASLVREGSCAGTSLHPKGTFLFKNFLRDA